MYYWTWQWGRSCDRHLFCSKDCVKQSEKIRAEVVEEKKEAGKLSESKTSSGNKRPKRIFTCVRCHKVYEARKKNPSCPRCQRVHHGYKRWRALIVENHFYLDGIQKPVVKTKVFYEKSTSEVE